MSRARQLPVRRTGIIKNWIFWLFSFYNANPLWGIVNLTSSKPRI
jgi:hypothetical protein